MAHKLPPRLESFLGSLCKAYGFEGEIFLQELIVNGRPRLDEGTAEFTDFGKTSIGHSLYLSLPEALYLRVYRRGNEYEQRILTDFNQLQTVQDEYLEQVRFELDIPEDTDWRRESGLLVTGEKLVTASEESRIWTPNSFRVFISHKSSVKTEANTLKEELAHYGVAAFVAHEDINPTREWQLEIENALASMDALVALLTVDFHDSDFTDQEIGYGFGRGVPLIAAKLGRDPYGFLGKFQGLISTWKSLPRDIVSVLMRHRGMQDAYINAIENVSNFDVGNRISSVLSSIPTLDKGQVNRLVNAFNTNSQVSRSFGFNGLRPKEFGGGLEHHLERITGTAYQITDAQLSVTQGTQATQRSNAIFETSPEEDVPF